MASQTVSVDEHTRVGTEVAFLSPLRCAAFALLFLAAFIFAFFGSVDQPRLPALVLAAYFAQALIFELIGFRADGSAIGLPRRAPSFLSFLVMGRRHVLLKDIENITATPSIGAREKVRMKLRFNGSLAIVFPSREKKLAFFDVVKSSDQRIPIYRSK